MIALPPRLTLAAAFWLSGITGFPVIFDGDQRRAFLALPPTYRRIFSHGHPHP